MIFNFNLHLSNFKLKKTYVQILPIFTRFFDILINAF